MSQDAPGRARGAGQALVEFALALPIFLLVVIAIFDVGRAVFAYNALTNAVREGARLGIVNQDPASIQTKTVQQAISLGLPTANVTVHFYQDDGTIPTDKSSPLPAPDALPASDAGCAGPVPLDCVIVVRARYAWTAITPGIAQLIGPQTFEATSVQPMEFTCPNETITLASSCPKQP